MGDDDAGAPAQIIGGMDGDGALHRDVIVHGGAGDVEALLAVPRADRGEKVVHHHGRLRRRGRAITKIPFVGSGGGLGRG